MEVECGALIKRPVLTWAAEQAARDVKRRLERGDLLPLDVKSLLDIVLGPAQVVLAECEWAGAIEDAHEYSGSRHGYAWTCPACGAEHETAFDD